MRDVVRVNGHRDLRRAEQQWKVEIVDPKLFDLVLKRVPPGAKMNVFDFRARAVVGRLELAFANVGGMLVERDEHGNAVCKVYV